MFNVHKILKIVSVLLIFVGVYTFWNGSASVTAHSDEPVWIMDAGIGAEYLQGNFDYFNISSNVIEKGWNNQEYRIIDQPQFGKLFFAAILSLADLQPWEDKFLQRQIYKNFVSAEANKLSGILEAQQELDQSIQLMRLVSRFLGLLSIVILGIVVFKITDSVLFSSLIFAVVSSSNVIHQTFGAALTDSLFMFLVMSFVLVFHLFSNSKKKVARFGYLLLAAIFLVTASLTKLPAFFLMPFVFGIQYFQFKKFGNARLRVIETLCFTIIFVLLCVLIEPYVLFGFPQNIILIFEARLQQQALFTQHFDGNYFQTLIMSIDAITNNSLYGVLLTIFILTIPMSLVYLFQNKKYQTFYLILGYFLLMIANTWYSSAYIERYGIPLLYIFSLIPAFYFDELTERYPEVFL